METLPDAPPAIEALNHASEEFAARRMNRSVAQALTGQNISRI